MLVIRKHGSKFIVEWEGMDIEFEELSKALVFVETVFRFTAMEVGMEELVKKAAAYDEIIKRENQAMPVEQFKRY